MKEILLATSNKGKIKELNQMLAPVVCIPQSTYDIPDAEETGLSFIENALIKARHASEISGKPALADDSGLVVPALNGEPGIYSARYAGADANDSHNIKRLLDKMKNFATEQRKAYFYCAMAIVQHAKDPTPMISTGIIHGLITLEPHGHEGFGYDPVFYIPDHECTAAQLPAAVKNTISHRAQALNRLSQLIQTL